MKLNTPNQLFRNNTASALREVHGALLNHPDPAPYNKAYEAFAVIGAIIGCTLLIFIASCMGPKAAHAKDYSNEQIVSAIYKAEGGKKSQYPYGIRSVDCRTEQECYRICLNTVRNNRVRFAKYGHKNHPDFISFLGSRYCPTNSKALSNNERRLNKYWIKNVRYFLEVA